MSRDYNKRYYKKHKEEIKAQRKLFYEANKERMRQIAREYYYKNKEECLQYESEYTQEHKEKIALRKKLWRESRIKNGICTPSMNTLYCWKWFGKRLKDLTLKERKLYKEKLRVAKLEKKSQ